MMRLLNAKTLHLETFDSAPRVSYAILSHTWEEEEVTFQDLESGRGPERRGWVKITACCAKARSEGYEYVWVDTCCIDKSSSAELSEAINSMFQYYQDAEVCYAYLADLDACREESLRPRPSLVKELGRSRWFTRGWTLQELLAPRELVFLSSRWEEIGTRDELSRPVSLVTDIDEQALQAYGSWSRYSVAARLSWAARRQTTRVEDEAYCLMGLFGVNMPLLYGEGKKAFRRLQLEIMKECYDPSILAWGMMDSYLTLVGVLAPSPAAFEGCGQLVYNPSSHSSGHDGGGGAMERDGGEYGNSRVSHEIIGSSLKMEMPVMLLREGETFDIRVRRNASQGDRSKPAFPGSRQILHGLAHWPNKGSYTQALDFLEYSYLHHNGHSVVLALLPGCQAGDGALVGIALCPDQAGLLKRVHYPTRFLATAAWQESNPDDVACRTLHISLAGSQTLVRPLVPAWTRCLVRLHGLLADGSTTYALSHTVPPMAVDAENCWYLNRWSEAVDRTTMTTQPCFSLHKDLVGRTIVFRHGTEPRLSFRVTFYMPAPAPPTGAGHKDYAQARRCLQLTFAAGEQVLRQAGGEESEKEGPDMRQEKAPSLPPAPMRVFAVEDRYRVAVNMRRGKDHCIAIVTVSELSSHR